MSGLPGDDERVKAARSVLIDVLTILGAFKDKLVVVGGRVPELWFPGEGHIGSLDVDLALDPEAILNHVYETISRALTDNGYHQKEMSNCFIKRMIDDCEVKVDLLAGDQEDIDSGSHILLQGMQVWKARGISLALQFNHELEISGILPELARNTVRIRVPTIPAYLCIKGIALSERKKEKGAYDIYFCVANYPGGPGRLANDFGPLRGHSLVKEGLSAIGQKFLLSDRAGPPRSSLRRRAGMRQSRAVMPLSTSVHF
jgi:hypothetical protein